MTSDTPDPMVVVRLHMDGDPPGVAVYGICRRSTAARLAADAGPGDEVTDFGPAAMALTAVYERKRAALGAGVMRVGTARDGAQGWLTWLLPSYPREPPPGSPAARAAQQ